MKGLTGDLEGKGLDCVKPLVKLYLVLGLRVGEVSPPEPQPAKS